MFHRLYTLELRLFYVAAVVLVEDLEDISDLLGCLRGQAAQLGELLEGEGVGSWKDGGGEDAELQQKVVFSSPFKVLK